MPGSRKERSDEWLPVEQMHGSLWQRLVQHAALLVMLKRNGINENT